MTWQRDAAMVALGALGGYLLSSKKDETKALPALTGKLVLEPDDEDDFDYVIHEGKIIGYLFPDEEQGGWWARLRYDGSNKVEDSATFDTKEEALEWLRQF